MALNTKAIKQRMKSITNTKKITKAMEMVSAAKMRRAVEAALRTRSYAKLAKDFMQRLSSADMAQIPFLQERPVAKVLLIYISSNSGLCGSFNANLFRSTATVLAQKEKLYSHGIVEIDKLTNFANVQVDMIGVGKKSALFAKKQGFNLIALFDSITNRPSFRDVLPITKLFMDGYVKNTYDKVLVAYTEFKSSVAQEPTVKQLLPISAKEIDALLQGQKDSGTEEFDVEKYMFEPNMVQIMSTVLPQLVEVQAYQALLESLASEHSARMVAMKNATDAAGDMLSSLKLSYNKARQAAITQEISEIVGGAAALE